MSALVLVVIAAITYGSRAVALAFLPRPGARLEAMLARMPAPIFAGLATATLLTSDRSLVAGPILWAALGALLVSPTRSLLFCLIGGAAGYALGTLLR
jgi:branched-subunit amino acid transport protein